MVSIVAEPTEERQSSIENKIDESHKEFSDI